MSSTGMFENEEGENFLFGLAGGAFSVITTTFVTGIVGQVAGVKYELIGGYFSQSSDGDFTPRDAVQLAGDVGGGLIGGAIAGALGLGVVSFAGLGIAGAFIGEYILESAYDIYVGFMNLVEDPTNITSTYGSGYIPSNDANDVGIWVDGSFVPADSDYRPISRGSGITITVGNEYNALDTLGVSETLCMRLSPCGFHGSSVEPFGV